MTVARLLLTVVLAFLAAQTASADDKNKSTKSKGAIEITDYGFGVEHPTSIKSKRTGSPSNVSRSINAGRPSGRH